MNGKTGRAHGDVNYEKHGAGYATIRRPDPRIAAQILRALGDARRVLNVGAGAGSYEPVDREVVAVEPSATMRAQRPPHLTPAIDATAENLPFEDGGFDASMALITVHQWSDLRRGLSEMRRVTRGPVIVMAFDSDAQDRHWLMGYAPELAAVECRRDPPMETLVALLGGNARVEPVIIPADCMDGFSEAYFARPERLLDPAVRKAQSSWSFLEPGVEDAIVARLRTDLESGAWDAKHGHWRDAPTFEGSLRLIVALPRG